MGSVSTQHKAIEQQAESHLSDENLNQIDFFASMTEHERKLLYGQGLFLSFKKNQRVFEPQSTEKNVYIVVSGTLQTFYYQDDKPLKLTVVGPGHKLGTVAWLDGKPSLSGCVAREKTDVFCLGEDTIEAIQKENTLLAASIQLRLLRYLVSTAWMFDMHYAQAKSIHAITEG